ncbi:MAG: tRNA (adenosine(37)-N6)-dimethylallyltransferase MiaA [Pseudomonadota bacterium]
MRRPLLITGPTASGKSKIAIRCAQRDCGLVVNADALQVYGCWQILTARPSPDDLAEAPHRLYGHIDAERRYSVGDWLRDLRSVLDEAAQSDLRPIIVGGTGLYMSSLVEGLADVPPSDPTIRQAAQDLIDTNGLDRLLADLERLDPVTLRRIDQQNPVRVQRAWEVLMTTGKGLADWQDATPPPLLQPEACDRIVVHPTTPVQNDAIEVRFRDMIMRGAIDEVRSFMDSGVSRALPSARALGAEQLMRYLEGEFDLETAIRQAVTGTRRFAKRQRTWFRSRMSDWSWLDPTEVSGKRLDQAVPSDLAQ